jgi:alkanesulfonate monooxygenase SsuD/methylene tetrahydromethanopterin reductase-like flavin-dependent oxidoreductase (luciferase family)
MATSENPPQLQENVPLRLGFFIQPVHPPSRNYRDVLSEDRAAISLADELGYKEAFVGEHLTDTSEPITSSLAFIASIADSCRSIVFGTAVLNLAVHHPVTVAAQVAMIDHLLDGRFLLGIGPGVPWDAEAFGILEMDRTRKMLETIDQVLAIWSGNAPYNLRGEYCSVSTARTLWAELGQGIVPRPLQQPHPPIIVTSIRPHSEAIASAAGRGWGVISSNYVQAHCVATHLPKYLEGRTAARLPADPSGWRVARSIFVADSEATARAYARSEAGPYGHYFRNMMMKQSRIGGLYLFRAHPNQPDSEVTLSQALATQVIAGTPESVVEQLLRFREEVGPFGTLLYTGHDWADAHLGRRSMELMATEVMPRLDKELRARTRPELGRQSPR